MVVLNRSRCQSSSFCPRPPSSSGERVAQPAVQDLITGRADELPLNIVVKPKVLPLPLERTVMMKPVLSQLGLPDQTVDTRWGEVSATTTVQVLAPLMVTEVL